MAVQSSIGVKRVVFEEVAELDTVGFGDVAAAVVGNAQGTLILTWYILK